MNDVVAEEERDVQSGFLDGDALHLSCDVGAVQAEKSADATGAYVPFAARIHGRSSLPIARRDLRQLAELLLERHEGEERVGYARCALRDARRAIAGARGLAGWRSGALGGRALREGGRGERDT